MGRYASLVQILNIKSVWWVGYVMQEQPRRKGQTLNFSEDGFPEVRQLGRSKVLPVNDTQENYDNAGSCYACVKQTSGAQPVWLKYDRQVFSLSSFCTGRFL